MTLNMRLAAAGDEVVLLPFMREFYASQGYAFDEALARAALGRLLGDGSLGRVWIVEADGAPIGYAALCFGYSLEYGGRDAILDEILISEAARGRGFGRRTLEFVLAQAHELGLRAVHLEMEQGNLAARALYGAGFVARNRHLLTFRIDAANPPPSR
jgi:GNAT superfamily N-acetyltransferase